MGYIDVKWGEADQREGDVEPLSMASVYFSTKS
jgi:hypothetical protein